MAELIHQAICEAAKLRPDATAFRCGKEQLSYSELDRKSNQVANLLLENGSQKGDRVGVFMPRSVRCAIAVYGILKAGCIFVPVDPHLTPGALKTIVNDAGISQLLTNKQAKVLEVFLSDSADTTLTHIIGHESNTGIPEIQPWARIDAVSEELPEIEIASYDAAYIMYSSGSTGKPKGITHSHFSGLSYSKLSIETYDVTSQDVIANHSPINFDMSTFGYFTSCLAGATTILVPEAHTKFPRSLTKLMADEKVTIWYSVPLALIQMLLRGGIEEHDLSSLRWIKFGGEPFPPKHLRSLMQILPQVRFSNVYGPAEVNQCTYYHLPAEFAHQEDDHPIPIGKIWNLTESRVLGAEDQPVDNGSTGELAVSSPTRMLGYWGRPEMTARSWYIEPSENGDDSKTFYRTGDLVRTRDDGNLMFLGRKDRQVKVRGYRIELDEVENAINGLAEIEEAGVYFVEQDHTKEVRATVIPKTGISVQIEEMKTQLAASLSQYAVPAKIEVVSELPRTGSGKIDRKQLRAQAEAEIS